MSKKTDTFKTGSINPELHSVGDYIGSHQQPQISGVPQPSSMHVSDTQQQDTGIAARSVCDILKSETDKIHNRLHHHHLLSRLVSPGVTLHDLAECLGRFAAFYNFYKLAVDALENQRCQETFERWMSPHLRWLKQDISTLNDRLSEGGRSECQTPYAFIDAKNSVSLPQQLQIDLNDAANVWGFLYVTEGSLMGGSVIDRCLAKHLNDKDIAFLAGESSAEALATKTGLTYFSGHGERRNQDHWQALKAAINTGMANADTRELKAVSTAAKRVFLGIEHVFNAKL